jgi:hypothetical protein
MGAGRHVTVDDVRLELERCTRRMAALSTVRLADAASATRPVLDLVEHWTAELEGRAPRPLPRLGDHAVADQLTVLVEDLLAAAPTGKGLAAVRRSLTQLRQHLP